MSFFDDIRQDYKSIKKEFDWNVKTTKWFKFNNENKLYVVGLDKYFNLTIIYQKTDIDLLRLALEDNNLNFNLIPNYIYVGNYSLFNDKDESFKILFKDKRYDFKKPTNKQLEVTQEVLSYLASVLEGDYDIITAYELPVWFIARFNDEYGVYNIDIVEFEVDYPISLKLGEIDNFDPKLFNGIENSYNIDLFSLDIPVYSYRLNKVINPLFLEITTKDNYYLKVIDYDLSEIPNITYELITSFETRPKSIMFFNKILYNSFKNADKNNELIIDYLPYTDGDSFFRISFVSNLFERYKNDVYEKGFVELDDLNILCDKIMGLYSFIYENTDDTGIDPYLIQAYDEEYYNLYNDISMNKEFSEEFMKYCYYFRFYDGLINSSDDSVEDLLNEEFNKNSESEDFYDLNDDDSSMIN